MSPQLSRAGALLALAALVVAAAAHAALPSLPTEPITVVPDPPAGNNAKVELGRLLFDSPALSGANDRTCLSCHDVRTNGASPRRFDLTVAGRPFAISTPTVFDAALDWRQGLRGTDPDLRAQADRVLHDPAFMNASEPVVLQRMRRSRPLRQAFLAAFDRLPDWGGLLDALAAYEATLLTPDSRFDRWLAGDHGALDPDELGGYRLFKSIGCIACHQGVNVGGNLFERQGVVDPTGVPSRDLFLVPSLRNVAVTPPYFHDGSAPTLADAVRRMGRAQLGWNLTDTETHEIVAFLGTLTGRYQGHLLTAPQAP